MNGTIDDLICLTLLIVFFGMYQRHRHQLYFRLWCVGWVFVFLSMVAWEVTIPSGRFERVQEILTYEWLVLGGMVFLLSMVVTRERPWRRYMWALTVAVPAGLCVAMEMLTPQRAYALSALVVVAQAAGMMLGYALLPKGWKVSRWLTGLTAVLSGVAMVVAAVQDERSLIVSLLPAEIMVCTAILYGALYGRRSAAGKLGALGFALWGGFYLASVTLPSSTAAWVDMMRLWNLPKELVGFAMILHVFEEGRKEVVGLAEQFRVLYEDFRLLYEGHPYPMWIFEEESGRVLSVNREAVRSYGYTEAEFQNLRMEDLEGDQDAAEEELRLLPEALNTRRERHRFKDGRQVWMNVMDSAITFQGREAKLRTARDITDKLKMNQELAHKAHHDALTGLPNRSLLTDRLQQTLARCERDDRLAVLFMIDVDHFKRVNDTYGHLIGDECLRQVAARLAAKIRQIDTIARVGGEEFAAMVGGLSKRGDAEKIAAMLLAQFDQPLRVGVLELQLTVSIGAAMYPAEGVAEFELLDMADRALYQAKRMGRNRVVFAGTMEAATGELLELPRMGELRAGD